MSRSLLGAGLGAAGATAYLRPDIVQDYAKELMWGPRPAGLGVAPMGKELEHLQRLVGGPPAATTGRGLLQGTPSGECCSAFAHLLHATVSSHLAPRRCRWKTCRAKWPPRGSSR